MGKLPVWFLLLVLAEALPAAAQKQITICVPDPEGQISAQLQKRLGEELRTAVEKYHQFKVVRGPALSARLLRLRARCIDDKPPCLVAMGRMARTERLLYSRIAETGGGQFKLDMFLVDVPGKLLLDQYNTESSVSLEALSGELAKALETILGPRTSGQLKISSNVTGAEVLLDGEPVGRTPLVLTRELAPGQHRIEVRHEGYLPAEQSFQVADNQGVTLHLQLEKQAVDDTKLTGGKEEEPSEEEPQSAAKAEVQPPPQETSVPEVPAAPSPGIALARRPTPGEDLSSLATQPPFESRPADEETTPPRPAAKPLWKNWWFWTAVGLVAAGSVALSVTLVVSGDEIPSGMGRVTIEF